jgi:hypothetical protein
LRHLTPPVFASKALELRGTESMKIQCGKAHFASLGVDYAHVVKASEV